MKCKQCGAEAELVAAAPVVLGGRTIWWQCLTTPEHATTGTLAADMDARIVAELVAMGNAREVK